MSQEGRRPPQDAPLESRPNIDSTAVDDALDALSPLVGLIPFVGSIISSLASGATTQRRFGRVSDELNQLYLELKDQREKVRHEYVRTEEFEELFVQTVDKMAKEIDPQRRAMYRSYLRHLLTEPPSSYRYQRVLLRLVDELLPEHVALLDAFSLDSSVDTHDVAVGAPIHVIRTRLASRYKIDLDDIQRLTDELERAGLLAGATGILRMSMTGSGASRLSGRVTPLGRDFQRFQKE